MSKLIIVIMQENEYPFGQCDNSMLEKKKIMVRKKIEFHPFQKKNMLLKARKIKGFINPFLIKLEQLLEEDTSLHLLFEYVPIKIQTWICNLNSEFIQNFTNQLFELADYLADNSILIDFKIKNIGMDQNYHPKYFIGLEYQINTLIGKDLLLEKYKTQINDILNPYRVHSIDNKKIVKAPEPSPEFYKKTQETFLKRQNQRSVKEFIPLKTPKQRSPETMKNQFSRRDSTKKVSDLSQNDLKLTFDGSQKVLFENLPKSISTNIKIQSIGKKINDLKNMIQNISSKHVERKRDSVSLSPLKGGYGEERPSSSYQKGLIKQLGQSYQKGTKIQKISEVKLNNEKVNSKELRQTQSQSQYGGKFSNIHGLTRVNEKMNISELKTKNEVRVIGGNKESYIHEFQQLLNDDIDQFASVQNSSKPNQQSNSGSISQLKNEEVQPKSPRFGLNSCPLEVENIKTEPQRYSYSYAPNKRKKSTDSLSSASDIKDRVQAVIGASRKLINNFRKTKLGQKKQFVPNLQ